MSLTIEAGVGQAFNRLTAGETSFMLCKYTDQTCTKLDFAAEGQGGMPEFLENLPEDEAAWGCFKVMGVDDRGNTISRRPKYIFVKFVPAEGFSAIKRAKVGRHKGDVKNIINAPIDFEIESKSELTEDIVVAKLRASGGAHAPTHYEFSNYSS